MNRIMDAVNRVLGRSVRDLAGEVDEALGRLAQARGLEATAQDALALAQRDVAKAQADVAAARDALFHEHPDLAPKGWATPTNQEQPMPDPTKDNPSAWEAEPVVVDDANDPRFTGGASPIPTGDDAPLPPIVWEEHDA